MRTRPDKIVSGGQSGVDRAALDVAAEFSLPRGGWCPRGRAAEDGPIADTYPLRETPSPDTAQRTEWNVRDADGTLVLTEGEPSGGTAVTIRFARRHGKPCLVLDLGEDAEPGAVGRWIAEHGIAVLNVAGPRESKRPGIYGRAAAFLRAALAEDVQGRS
ncbi:MAG: putative molybdenum carrier protein [Gemmatimonadota bacterium]